ncbi:GNAT family N-acetyltransferase [Bacillus sp. AK128]
MGLTCSIVYKEVTNLDEIKEIVALQEKIWSQSVVTPLPQLVAAFHHGGVVIGAFHQDKIIGFSYGFPGFKGGNPYLISHMTAVLPEYQNAGVGLGLKLKQREWAISTGGYEKIVWTYDPLEARNGYFNLMKLGGYSRQYINAYYGIMEDKLNQGLPSDRFLVEWDICSERVEKAISHQSRTMVEVNHYPVLLEMSGYAPVNKQEIGDHSGYLIAVPSNIQEIKQQNLDIAKQCRFDLRYLFTDAISKGFVVTGMLKAQDPGAQYYVIEKQI